MVCIFGFLQSLQASDFCLSWPPGTCLDDTWIHPRNLTPSSPKDVQTQLCFARTQQGQLLPVVHIEWTLQTDGEWASGSAAHLPVNPQIGPPGPPPRLRTGLPALCSDTRGHLVRGPIVSGSESFFSVLMLTHHPSRKAFLQPKIFITLEKASGRELSDCRAGPPDSSAPTSQGWICAQNWEDGVTRASRPVDGLGESSS